MKARAFTLIELLVVIFIISMLVGMLLPALGSSRNAARQLKDCTQIRSVHQAMVIWAGHSQDNYPLPSRVDPGDTIPGIDTQDDPGLKCRKDLPRWMMSLLINNGGFTPGALVSPLEVNALIRVNDQYQFSNPIAVAAEKRNRSVLDPSFACYPDEIGGDSAIRGAGGVAPDAGCSYAFMPAVGARKDQWRSTFDSSLCIAGNRGPWYRLVAGEWKLDPTDKRGEHGTAATSSNTLRIHPGKSGWRGNVARNDNSVTFETKPDPDNIPISYALAVAGSEVPRTDNIFANEYVFGDGATYLPEEDEISRETFLLRRSNYLRCFGGGSDGQNTVYCPCEGGRIIEVKPFWYD